jgi:protein-tyrosine kinase
MSRIHDALKKAAEERQAAGDPAAFPGVEDLFEPAEIVETPDGRGALRGQQRDGRAGGVQKFDDLVAKCVKTKWTINSRLSVFDGPDDRGIGAERFRTLRSRLYQIASTRPIRRILVTSSLPAEGKTFVAANLAQSIIRQPDRRVLLIDADLRASRLHFAFGTSRNPGLSDYISGDASEFQIIQKGMEANLFIVPGGREVANPSELLLHERMKKFLDWATPCFDWVILDSPPAVPVHDASLLADVCDGVLFVVRAGATDYEIAEKAAEEFQDKNLLGVVLNRVEKGASYNDYYYEYSAKENNDKQG